MWEALPVQQFPPGWFQLPPPEPKHLVRKVVLPAFGVLIVLFVIALVFGGPLSRMFERMTPGFGGVDKMGSSVEVETGTGAATVTVSDLKVAPGGRSSGRLEQITVVIRVTAGRWPVGSDYFTARTGVGTDAKTAPVAAGDGIVQARLAQAGETFRGTIVFDVPAGESISQIVLIDLDAVPLAVWSA